MSRLFVLTLISAVVSMSFGHLEKDLQMEKISLALRADPSTGIQLPASITNIPLIGPILSSVLNSITQSSGTVMNPAMELLSMLTGGMTGKNSSLFIFADKASGGIPSMISGSGGLTAPNLDLGELTKGLTKLIDSASTTGLPFLTPIFQLFQIPANLAGEILTQLSKALKMFPFLQVVNPTQKPPVSTNG